MSLLGGLVSTLARGIHIPPVLSPEWLLEKLTLVQTKENVLGVVQLSDGGDGTLFICPVEELALGEG